ncbi:CAMK family protein kinase [Tritrichomonas foetus]|uniref:CAMK family protein kinase n=1 Tax=Tritrichomonas foetus TaxID=1144522 RepID=A0A1J4KUY8_9EUKA|nr:CAMK family protein kinase [Tritrichomonas foetus]|eukprot:OHT13502.1 CAMK family protein kinase [Tritrichomonas foetus]
MTSHEQPIDINYISSVIKSHEYQMVRPIYSGISATCFLVYSTKYRMNFVCKAIKFGPQVICSHCELDALKRLNSCDVINLYDFITTPHYLFLILEFCSNGTLQSILEKQKPFTGRRLLGLCKCILLAVSHIHSCKCAHLDIKPSNILVDRYGRPKLADFGISRFIFSPSRVFLDQRAGTALFMAPEITTQNNYNPFKADIFSLGVTFYYLATKQFPFPICPTKEGTLLEIRNGNFYFEKYDDNGNPADQEVMMLIKKMMDLNPSMRPTAEQLLKLDIFQEIDKKDGFLPINHNLQTSSTTLTNNSNHNTYYHDKNSIPRVNLLQRRNQIGKAQSYVSARKPSTRINEKSGKGPIREMGRRNTLEDERKEVMLNSSFTSSTRSVLVTNRQLKNELVRHKVLKSNSIHKI